MLGAKGLAGAFRVEPLTDRPDRLAVGALLFLEGEADPTRITAREAGGRVPVLSLEGVTDREAAEALAGRFLEVEAEPLPEGTWYWHQLVGLRVADQAGRPLGTVVEVFRAGENEVYRIEGPEGELLLPAIRDVVLAVDVGGGTMTVRWQPEEVR
ncbi:MAG TPA: ribosome maturation factor RimM [Candidatus Limnocylindria bacterium]